MATPNPGEPVKKKNVIKRMADSMSTQRIVIDLNYENFMSEKERMSLAKQLEFCYSSNRYSAQPFQLYFTSTVDIIVSERFVQTIPYWRSWDVFWKNENFMHLFKSEDLVYLTGDSPNILIDLDPKSVYIIGGLVDHNRHKGLTLRRAESCGIRHACLPIAEHLKLSSSKVLTVDQGTSCMKGESFGLKTVLYCFLVFKILVEFQNCNDWLGALLAVVPSRKLLRLNSGDHPTVETEKLA
ncbi:hypothetical protein Zmor_008921 [Zophobas morio]|uniref:tRNA (guanine(9)-N(1))-methyltransferase n=1 Tax=Zophobas morio TaxID=2755281 RepID=A0AA38HJ36_9CUCU|nr:hypothetical protein Zmor_008921 [Zophobas morio]